MVMDTDKSVIVKWGMHNHDFQKQGIPFQFNTTSQVCIMLNDAPRYKNLDVKALFNRSRVLIFDPTPAEVVSYARTWWVQENGEDGEDILNFCEQHLQCIRRLDCRDLGDALQELRRDENWKDGLLRHWGAQSSNPETQKLDLIKDLEKKFPDGREALAEYKRQTKEKRNSYQENKKKLKEIEVAVALSRRN